MPPVRRLNRLAAAGTAASGLRSHEAAVPAAAKQAAVPAAAKQAAVPAAAKRG